MAVTKKDYVIPLRKGYGPSAPHKKTPKAMRVLKAFVVRHSKVDEKDVKIGAKLNQLMWENGIRNPPAKVAVSITVDNGVAKVELQGHDYKEAPKIKAKSEPETLKDKLQDKLGVKADKEELDKKDSVDSDSKDEEPAAQEKDSVSGKEEEKAESKPEAKPVKQEVKKPSSATSK